MRPPRHTTAKDASSAAAQIAIFAGRGEVAWHGARRDAWSAARSTPGTTGSRTGSRADRPSTSVRTPATARVAGIMPEATSPAQPIAADTSTITTAAAHHAEAAAHGDLRLGPTRSATQAPASEPTQLLSTENGRNPAGTGTNSHVPGPPRPG